MAKRALYLLREWLIEPKFDRTLSFVHDLAAVELGETVHVSKNLNIPFAQLKCTELATKDACTTMNGTTTETMTVPSKSSSLGQAIHTLKPPLSTSDSKTAAKQAQKEADGDLRSTAS